jgi:hypothetical protein
MIANEKRGSYGYNGSGWYIRGDGLGLSGRMNSINIRMTAPAVKISQIVAPHDRSGQLGSDLTIVQLKAGFGSWRAHCESSQPERGGAAVERQLQCVLQPAARAQRPFISRPVQIGGGQPGRMGSGAEPLPASEPGADPTAGLEQDGAPGAARGFVTRAQFR